MDKEQHSVEVRNQMAARENNRVGTIKQKREQKEQVMQRTQSEKHWQLALKREMELIKREDRQENVERISKAQQYQKDIVQEKIQYDNMRSMQVQREKEKLLESRFQVRREADKQKQDIFNKFESMKKKGKVDVRF